MSDTIIHVDPNARDPSSYTNHLFAYNKAIQRKIAEQLEVRLRDIGQEHAIVTIGSDARLEKGPVSPIQLVILTHDISKTPVVINRIREYMHNQGSAIFDDFIELKDIDQERMSQATLERSTGRVVVVTSPNRMLDAWFLAGNEGVYGQMQQRLVAEIMSEEGKTIKEEMRQKVSKHRRVAVTGIQRYKGQDIKHFDLQAGIAHYDPEKGLWSFKQGPLRLVQYALVRDQIRALREGCNPDVLLYASRNTVAKLHDLEVNGAAIHTNHTTVTELTEHYAWFLWGYHRSQAAYQEKKLVCGFDAREATSRATALERICSEPIFRVKQATQ